ncbi:MAG: hypothetical protein HY655_14060 [Acidobacteria bacterium]|nr:hypothetical protein [Acidobacteriota bacterium]
MLLLVAAFTAATLVLAAQSQTYDTNFYLLREGTALLLGDHLYREFFERGAPPPAYLSAVMQLVFGYPILLMWNPDRHMKRRRQPTRTFEPGGYPCFR